MLVHSSQLKKISILFFTLCSFCTTNGQEQHGQDLFAHFESYQNLLTNDERHSYLVELTNLVKEPSANDLETLLSRNPGSFVERFALAEYWRFQKDYQKTMEIYTSLEADVLKNQPIDYVLLAMIRWNSSYNISLENFSYEQGLDDLNKGLEYAEQAKVDKQIIEFHSNLSFYNNMASNYEASLRHNKLLYDLAIKTKDTLRILVALKSLMGYLSATENSAEALKVWDQMRPIFEQYHSKFPYPSTIYASVTDAYSRINQLDSAQYYNDLCFKLDSLSGNLYFDSKNRYFKGNILMRQKAFEEAKLMFESSHRVAQESRNKTIETLAAIELSQLYLRDEESAKAVALLSTNYANRRAITNPHKAHLELSLSKAYEAENKLDSALHYRNKSDATRELASREIAKREAALAKVEMDVDSYIQKNQDLEQSNEALNKKVSKTTTTQKILIYSFLAIALLTIFFFYRRSQKEKLRLSQYQEQLSSKERMVIEAELNSIRSQMNPHFMFNSLNSINEFIQNDSSEDASNYLVKFSRLMRSTLNYSKRKYVSLKEEIDLLNLYLELESLRFYNSIAYSFDIDPHINLEEIYIPPMMLQPFVENAIWHGLMAKEGDRKLELRFFEQHSNLICEIEDNGIGRAASAAQNAHKTKHKSQGIGLTERRLELLKSIHGQEAGVHVLDLFKDDSASGTLVKVTLPKQQQLSAS